MSATTSNETDFHVSNVKIKQEKITPPPSPNGSVPQKDITEQLLDNFLGEKKPVAEPVKSSNEILADLFKVFNAAPPELENIDQDADAGDSKSHKHKKKHKKEKKAKKSKHKKKGRSSSGSGGESVAATESLDKQIVPTKLTKVKKEKKRAKRKADDDDNLDGENAHKRRKKSKDRDKTVVIKIEGGADGAVDHASKSKSKKKIKSKSKSKSREKSVDRTKHDGDLSAIDRLNEKLKERRQLVEKQKECDDENAKSTSTKTDGDSTALGRKKIVIKSLVNSSVYHDTLKEVDAKQKEKDKEKEKERDERRRKKEKERESRHEKTRDRVERKRGLRSKSSSLSLSDEETYLKERENRYKHMDYDRDRDDFYGDNRRHDRTRNDRYDYKEKSFRSSHYDRRRSRSNSRRGNSEDRIDKKRLLEVARKNAITMLKNGTLPGVQNLAADDKEKALAKMRYGGKSVDELTEFCKMLSKGDATGYLSNVTDSEDDADIDKPFNHPFVLKDRGSIVMNIKNSTPIPPKTSEQTKQILMLFPVSSGQHHRATESEWVPVDATKPQPVVPKPQQEESQPSQQQQRQPLAIMPAPCPAPSETVTKPIQPEPVPVPVPAPAVTATDNSITPSIPLPQPVIAPAPPVITSETFLQQQQHQQHRQHQQHQQHQLATYQYKPAVENQNQTNPSNSIFPDASNGKDLDVTSIITKRLNAMRKLQDNPLDTEALKLMYNTQKDMSTWANSKFVPGQFTGSTGANVLSAKELSSGFQAWAKRDQLISTTPVSGGMGMHLLQKMGWRPGEGLGKEKNGSLQPLLLEVKLDKRGLVADEETPQHQRQAKQAQQAKKRATSIQMAQQNMESKHPVSLLGELCAKRKYGAPSYEVVMEDGPFHHRKFLFKVSLNGQEFRPTIPSLNKKEAKAVAARFALEQMGVLSTQPNAQ